MKRRIFHVDMNSFFASCEEASDANLKGKNVAVAGDPKKRHGIILAANYAAKSYGVNTTMPIWKALNVCPNLIILPCNMGLYKEYSNKMISILGEYAPVVEQVSIDEAFLDFTGTDEIYGDFFKLALEIQTRILEELRLKCSIGISENKLLAKMASDYKKPLGITEIYQKDVKEKIWDLDVGELFLVGKSTSEALKKIGIYKIGDLARYDFNTLKIYLGEKSARRLIDNANGIDDSEVIPTSDHEMKSNGAELTFSEDVKDMEILKNTLFEFSERIAKNLRDVNKKAKTIALKLKYENFTSITRNITISISTNLSNIIYENAVYLLEKNYNREYKIRLIGLSCTNFVNEEDDFRQLSLFETEEEKEANKVKDKLKKLDQISDKLRDKYGEEIIIRAKRLNNRTITKNVKINKKGENESNE